MQRSAGIAALSLLLLATVAFGQASPRWTIRKDSVHVLSADVGGERVDYKIIVALPREYDKDSAAYPVVYYTDAWYLSGIVEETYSWLRAAKDIRPFILVGISWDADAPGALHQRSRDLTPTADSSAHYRLLPTSGGGEDFYRFLTKDLIPYIDGKYRTLSSERGLLGYSLGGLFSSWVLINHTDMFERYLLGSPYVRWDKWLVLRQEAERAAKSNELKARAYACSGTNDDVLPDFKVLKERFESRHYRDFEFKAELFQDEDHGSLVPTCFSRALRYLYAPKPASGVSE